MFCKLELTFEFVQEMVVLRHRSTRRGASRANQNTVAGIGSPNNDSSQMSRSDGINTTAPLSQNSEVIQRQPPSRQKGRKRRATTELRVPPHGHKVGLEPEGDRYGCFFTCAFMLDT